MNNSGKSRRLFIKTSAAAAAGITILPGLGFATGKKSSPLRRSFGRLNFEVTTLGLGGQASIQWTPDDVDPEKIILKAFDMGINYFDTSNLYGPSQLNYGKAFDTLNLIPTRTGYDELLRRSIFLTTKTHLRFAKGGDNIPRVSGRTNGADGSNAIDDIRRSLSQMFGDGKGNYPKNAYLDMVLIHNLNTMEEVDALYEGLHSTDPKAERIGALAALRDFRDGTNLTGLNPYEEKIIRHIGFSGHFSPPVMMEMIQRDQNNLLDAMLVAVNANDRLNFNMQHNVIPVATARNMGIIAMKVFADGAMYTKDANWTRDWSGVVRTVGSKDVPSRSLIQYSLTTPGIHTAIIGIGQINEDPALCQLEQNLSAAQVNPESFSGTDRLAVEQMTIAIKDGETNYFQMPKSELTAAVSIKADQRIINNQRYVELTWNSAYAGNEPLWRYEIRRDGEKIGNITHKPQTTKDPFVYSDRVNDHISHEYTIVTADFGGRTAESDRIRVEAL